MEEPEQASEPQVVSKTVYLRLTLLTVRSVGYLSCGDVDGETRFDVAENGLNNVFGSARGRKVYGEGGIRTRVVVGFTSTF